MEYFVYTVYSYMTLSMHTVVSYVLQLCKDQWLLKKFITKEGKHLSGLLDLQYLMSCSLPLI